MTPYFELGRVNNVLGDRWPLQSAQMAAGEKCQVLYSSRTAASFAKVREISGVTVQRGRESGVGE